MNTQDLESALLLNSVPEIGPVRHRALVRHFGTAQAALSAPLEELIQVEGVFRAVAQNVLEAARRRDWVAEEISLARKHQVEILTPEHAGYPALLNVTTDPPPVLYCRGNLDLLNSHSIALVGSRHCTPYGERAAKMLSGALAERGITTVSGLARGIDTHVHRATLEAKGATIAVLGSGLLSVYPRENIALAEMLYREGLVISEFPLKEQPLAGHFPRRNRIISGLAWGVVVVEAGEKSGALITATYATEQGREVFAVPGSIFSAASQGSNRFIQDGVKPVYRVEDILEEIAAFREKPAHFIYKEESEIETQNLTRSESAVLEALCSDPIHIDRLSQQLKFSPGAFYQVLLDLELKGMIKPLPGKMYVRI